MTKIKKGDKVKVAAFWSRENGSAYRGFKGVAIKRFTLSPEMGHGWSVRGVFKNENRVLYFQEKTLIKID
jgi:hypothetical protein